MITDHLSVIARHASAEANPPRRDCHASLAMTGKKGCNAPVSVIARHAPSVIARHASAEAIPKLVAISYQPSAIGYPLTADY
jgi:hypothetical protein